MDARVLLQNTLHTDASVRADAEAKLNQASSENFVGRRIIVCA